MGARNDDLTTSLRLFSVRRGYMNSRIDTTDEKPVGSVCIEFKSLALWLYSCKFPSQIIHVTRDRFGFRLYAYTLNFFGIDGYKATAIMA